MGKISKNARVGKGRGAGDGGKNYVKIIVSEKSEKTGAYIFKEKMVHKDEVKQALGGK